MEWEVVSFRRGVSNVRNVGASPSLCERKVQGKFFGRLLFADSDISTVFSRFGLFGD